MKILEKLGMVDRVDEAPSAAKKSKDAKPSITSAAPAMSFPVTQPNIGGTVSFIPSAGVTATDSDDMYQKLAAMTDFDTTNVGAKIKTYVDSLASIIADPTLRLRAAFQQAKALGGITEQDVLNTFEKLKITLSERKDKADAKAAQFHQQEIEFRQNRVTEIEATMSELQGELSRLAGEIVEAQGKTARISSQFNAALARRSAEIDQQMAQMAALLKG